MLNRYGSELQPMWDAAVDAWIRIVTEEGGDVCMAAAKQVWGLCGLVGVRGCLVSGVFGPTSRNPQFSLRRD